MTGLRLLAGWLDVLAETIGRATAWLGLAMVLLQSLGVVLRYIFGVGFEVLHPKLVWLNEGTLFLHGVLFMLAGAYTLRHDGHVRVDVFYRGMTPRRRALVDLLGTLVFLLPLCALIGWASWDYALDSWRVRESSAEASGIPIYALKAVIPLFAGLMALQGLSMMIHALAVLADAEDPADPT